MDTTLFLHQFGHLVEGKDGIKKLREVILQFALQGKLVEQDAREGTAKSLLKEIEIQKKQFFGEVIKKTYTLKPNESYIAYKIPQSWIWTQLGVIARYGLSEKVRSNREIADDTWVLDLEDIEKETSRIIQFVKSSSRPFQSTKTVFKKMMFFLES
jgi:type I restriction enzyme, S subunit